MNVRERLTQNARREHAREWAKDWTPKLKRKVSTWATEVRIITAGTSPLAEGRDIPYDHSIMPHAVEVMDAVDEHGIRIVAFWGAVRDCKTDLSKNIAGRTVTDAPGNIYDVHPTEDNADTYSNGDIEPFIEASMPDYFVEKKSRDTGRTIEMKKFKGGWWRIFSANALAKFHGTSVAVLLLHELDKLSMEAIQKSFGRTTGFKNAIIYMESTGTLAAEVDPENGKKGYRSNIEEIYDQGDKRKWFCPCRECGHLQTLKYEQIKYPPGNMPEAYYECHHCGAAHDAKAWRKMAASGKWYPTAGLSAAQEDDIESNFRSARALDPSVRSYWRNGFNSLLPCHSAFKNKLHEFVALAEASCRTTDGKKRWTQEVKAELWSPETEGEAPPAWKPLFDARSPYGLIVPQGGLFLTAFVDCQLGRLEVGWRAWGRNEESWGMAHRVLAGHIRDPEVWQQLRRELAQEWTHANGAKMHLGMAFVDGGAYAEDVYRFFVELSRNPAPHVSGYCRASKGVGQHGHPIITRKMMTIAKNLKGHHIGTWEAKDRIYERLRMERVVDDTREGVMHFNMEFSEEYFQQLTSEQVTVDFEKGVEVRKYINPKRVRNEALDIEVGNLAALRLHPRNFDALEEELRERAAQAGLRAGLQESEEFETTAASSYKGRGWRL